MNETSTPKLDAALAEMADGESRQFGAVTLHTSKDGLSSWASGPGLKGTYLHTDPDEKAAVEALLTAEEIRDKVQASVDRVQAIDQELVQRDREIILSQLRRYTVDLVSGAENSFIFAIFDRRAMRYGPPTTAYSAFIILRELAAMIKRNPSIPFAQNPDDFVLHCLGSYNELTGVISGRDDDDPVSGRIGTIRDLLEIVRPVDVTDFLRSALEHAQEAPNS